MNKKFVIVLVALIIVLLIGAGIIAWVFLADQDPNVNSNRSQNTNVRQNTTNRTTTNTQTTNTGTIEENTNQGGGGESLKQNTEDEIMSLSRSFIERFGTFSNQNEYENINNLRIYMTKRMQAYADTLIQDAEKKGEGGAYYGITTKVVSVEILELAGTAARVRLTTQRKETKEGGESKVFYQDVELGVVQESSIWKIDNVTWK